MFHNYDLFGMWKYLRSQNCKVFVKPMWGIFFCAVFICTSHTAKCQWKIWHYQPKQTNLISLLPPNAQLKKGFTFFGKADDYRANVITKGYAPFLKNRVWKIKLNEIKSGIHRHINFNLYTRNVAALRLLVCEANGNRYEQQFKFDNDGYQIPLDWKLDEVSTLSSTINNKDDQEKLFCYATIELKENDKEFEFVVGEAKSYQEHLTKAPSKGLFFNEITNNKENKINKFSVRKFGNIYPLVQITELSESSFTGYNIEFDSLNYSGKQGATLTLIRSFFQKYQFYSEHLLSKTKVLASIDSIILDTVDFKDKVELLSAIADKLYDAHFYFQKSESNKPKAKVSSPLILKRLNNKVQIVGIRDNRLAEKISLGDQIYMLDGKLCEEFINQLSINYFGDLSQRQELAISHLLEKKIDSSTYNMIIEKPDGSRHEVVLRYDKTFPIPKNFVPKHFGFSRLKNNWSYLKINKWEKGDWIKFYNLKDSIRNSEGIIFDLRGNPGGFEIETIKIASCFLSSTFEYSTQTYEMQNKLYSGKTIVKPNGFLNLSKLKVVILVDNKTACVSESFALILKDRKNAKIIGTAKTGSSFSTIYSFQISGGITLHANILSKIYLLKNKYTLENNGITPDYIVKIDSYPDLYGYNDKVLRTAIDLINQDQMILP